MPYFSIQDRHSLMGEYTPRDFQAIGFDRGASEGEIAFSWVASMANGDTIPAKDKEISVAMIYENSEPAHLFVGKVVSFSPIDENGTDTIMVTAHGTLPEPGEVSLNTLK